MEDLKMFYDVFNYDSEFDKEDFAETDYFQALEDERKYQEELETEQLDKHIEEHYFTEIKGCGYFAPAYKKSLDNQKMIKLRREGNSLRKIAEILGCSPSTVRNRLKKLGELYIIP